MLPRYTIDIAVPNGITLSGINLSIPIRWDMNGKPTHYKNVPVPFAVVAKHKTRCGEIHVARILTMHQSY